MSLGGADPAGRRVWVRGDGARLYAEVAGTGVPLLLIHGWPLDHRCFSLQIPELSRHFRTIAYDRRGFGRSRALPDLRRELGDIDRILDELADGPAHLLGMSQGARVALRYAVTRPGRLRSLLLQGAIIDGVDEGDSDDRVPIAQYAELVRQGRIGEVRRRWWSHPMMAIDARHHQARALLQRILADYRGADLRAYDADGYRFPVAMTAALAGFTLPTLILTGAAETESRRAHAAQLLRLIASARELRFENSGHLSNLTEPAGYNQAVIEFCRSVDVSPPRP